MTTKERIMFFMSPVLFPMFRLYWWLFRPTSYGVKVVIENDGALLILRNSYGWKRWTFPGGKIEKNEKPIEAARREVREETGIEMPLLEEIGRFESRSEHKHDNVFVFFGRVSAPDFKINPIEIEEAKWVKESELPELGPVATEVAKIYRKFRFSKNKRN